MGRGTTRAQDAQGTPTQSHTSPNILVYEKKKHTTWWSTTLSSKMNLHHATNFEALCGGNLENPQILEATKPSNSTVQREQKFQSDMSPYEIQIER